MQDFPENDFDNFIRKAVEEPKLPFDPKAWNAMEKKLDGSAGYIPSTMIDFFSTIALLIMLSYLTWSGSTTYIKVNNQHTSKALTPGFENLSAQNQEGSKENSKENRFNIFPELGNNGNSKAFKSEIPSENKSEIPGKKEINSKKRNIKIFGKDESNINPSQKEINKVQLNTLNNITNSGIADRRNSDEFKHPVLNRKTFLPISVEYQKTKEIPVLPVKIAEIVLPDKNYSSQPKWGINLLLSPDLSAVNLSDVRTSGTNLGISLEYYLSSRWRISLGAIRSEKIYSLGDGYSSGYTSTPVNLEKVDANCSVIDIPLILRFNAVSKGNNHFFISSGFSSYLMLKEDYDFTYQNYNSTYTYSKNIRNENNHFFEILNLSIGFEREIGRRISLQAEPFIKAPISDIGYGKVKLLTTGAFFSLKYKIY